MLIPNFLKKSGLEIADRLAISSAQGRLTFGELYAQVCRLAGQLAAQGIGAESRLALLMGNRLQFALIAHAVMQLGATLVPLNLRLTAAELNWQLQDVGASLLLTDEPNAEKASAACPPTVKLWQWDALEKTAVLPFNAPETLDLTRLYTIVYSSGTTGQPKGVQHLLNNHYASALASRQNLPVSESDCWLAVLPLFHVGGFSILMRGLFYTMPVILHESFDPVAVNRALDEEGVTIVSVVATMLSRMLDARHDQPYPPTFRCMLAGGGPVPRVLLERCAAAAIPVMQTYGMTETTSQAATLSPQEALRKLGSAGQPLPGVELRIEQDGAAVKPGEVGEIVLRGAIVTSGYDKRPEATAQAWRNGWFHSGDLGYLDDEGFLFVVDRRDDLIISGGENIYPAEVEAVLLAHPAIEEAGVVGLPHEKWGQVPIAFIKLRPGYTLMKSEIIEFCQVRLARYKMPADFIFTPENLPRNAAGKLLRRILRTWLKPKQ